MRCSAVAPAGALLLAMLGAPAVQAAEPARFEAQWPAVRLWVGATDVEGLVLTAVDAEGRRVGDFAAPVRIEGLSLDGPLAFADGKLAVPKTTITAAELVVRTASTAARAVETRLPVPTTDGLWSLLPALLAIGLALATRQVLLSLLGGVWLGAAILHGGPIVALPRSLDLIAGVAANPDRVKIMVFTLMMGGMVGVISASGGTAGIVDVVVRRAKSPRSASLATWGMGMLVFFDDYASSLLVGSTMRPVTDKFGISREKLSYLVDSTAAPIASLALVSTWVGYEVSLLGDAMKAAGIERDAYDVFLSGLPSRFYQVFALLFVVMIALSDRDFGPMLKAERRARLEGKPIRDGGQPLMDTGLMEEAAQMRNVQPRWWLALTPIGVLVGTVLIHLWTSGTEAGRADPAAFAAAQADGVMRLFGYVLSNAASYDALLYGAGFGAGSALLLAVLVRAGTVTESIDALVRGVRAMSLAILVLVLAWSIGKVMEDLRAGAYVAGALGDTLPAWTLPSLTFILAGLIALATGTSWGTMAILFPIVIPLVAAHRADPAFEAILLGTASAILGGSVFGDHCSPISDTTVLSSIASASDHVDHTRTQAPYALLCAAVTLGIGYIPLGFGLSPWVSMGLGLVVLLAVLRLFGRVPE